jgi:serine kinase of HPr protein (carbohydrate metabolism regulator)
MHGVFMDVLGVGVLITGESGLGKSELGLELIRAATAWWPMMRWSFRASRPT